MAGRASVARSSMYRVNSQGGSGAAAHLSCSLKRFCAGEPEAAFRKEAGSQPARSSVPMPIGAPLALSVRNSLMNPHRLRSDGEASQYIVANGVP
jgi:hypothetical protein